MESHRSRTVALKKPIICCFGVFGSFDYDHIGGTDSYCRRIGKCLAKRGYSVKFLLYDCPDENTDQPLEDLQIIRKKDFKSALQEMSNMQGSVLVSAIKREHRIPFIHFRHKYGETLSFYLVPSVFYENPLHNIAYFMEAALYHYNGGIMAMSPRLQKAGRTAGNKSFLVLPPVPEEYFNDTQDKPDTKLTVTYMGRSIPGKGADKAIEIFKQLESDKNIETQFCGYIWPDDREDTSIHEQLLKQDKIKYICEEYQDWTPAIDSKVAKTLKDTDILLLPYRKLSSTIDMPLLLLEGMAANCMIITPDMGDMKSVYGTDKFMPPDEDFVNKAVETIRCASASIANEKERLKQHTDRLAFNTESITDQTLDIITSGIPFLPDSPAGSSSELIAALRERFADKKISYCVLRNYEKLPEDHGNDLDIFIAPDDFDRGIRTLRSVIRNMNWRVIAELKPMNNRKLYCASPDEKTPLLIIDVFQDIYWKGIPSSSVEHILDTRKEFNEFSIAAPGVEGSITLMKELLMFGKVKSRRGGKARIKHCAQEDPELFCDSLKSPFGAGIADWITDYSKTGEWEILEREHKTLRNTLAIRAFKKSPARQLKLWWQFITQHMSRRSHPPMGMFVVLIGPDGSGKSTAANYLADFWMKNIHADSFEIHGDFKIIPRLKNIKCLLARISGKTLEPEPDFTEKHSGSNVKPHPTTRSIFSLIYYMLDYILGHFVIRRHKAKDKLIIADRYFHDYYFQPANSKLPKCFLKFIELFIPKPDLLVYLERDPETIYKAKDELTIKEIQRQQDCINRFIKNTSDTVVVNGSKNSVMKVLREHILAKLAFRNHNRTI